MQSVFFYLTQPFIRVYFSIFLFVEKEISLFAFGFAFAPSKDMHPIQTPLFGLFFPPPGKWINGLFFHKKMMSHDIFFDE